MQRLGCSAAQAVKVLSIFGNTGDGKSHTLNHVLFDGEEVFATSPSPSSCTVGVWAAYDPHLNLIVLDTEGLLGAASQQNRRMRLLLKVLAVSDVVVYRTRAERLHNDMFQFLGSASAAYLKHFTPELRTLSNRCGLDVPLSSLGPAVIVFQETSRTQLLGQGKPEQADFHVYKTRSVYQYEYSFFLIHVVAKGCCTTSLRQRVCCFNLGLHTLMGPKHIARGIFEKVLISD